MYKDLLARYELVGLSQAALVELLGEPTRIDRVDGSEIWSYRLGLERSSPAVDSLYLQVTIARQAVTGAEVVPD